MAENIKKTLLNSFFLTNRGKKELKENISIIFPCKDLFIKFLKTSSSIEQKQLANRIILRLCFGLSFPPPSMLIKNLQKYEEEVSHTTDRNDFVMQDHFLHLVNLYMLGIYFYINHNSLRLLINNKINAFKRKLSKKNKSSLNLDPIVIFSKMWSYFVVYHDLGYPVEGFKSKSNIDESKKDFTKVFKNLKDYLNSDLSIKTISKVIAIESVFDEIEGSSLKELYFAYIENITIEQDNKYIESTVSFEEEKEELTIDGKKTDNTGVLEIVQKLFFDSGDYVHIPKLDNYKELLYRVTSLINKNEITAILENNDTGVPIALISGEKSVPVIYLQTKDSIPKSILNKNLYDFAFYEESMPQVKYSLRYFINKPKDQYQDIINGIFIDCNVKEAFYDVKNYIQVDVEYNEYKIKNSSSIEDIEFFIFYSLQDVLGYTITDDVDYLSIAQLSKSFANANQNVAKKLPLLISDLIRENYKNYIKETDDFNPKAILKEEIPSIAAGKFFDQIIKLKQPVCEQLSKDIISNLKDSSNKETNLSSILNCIQKMINENITFDTDNELDKYFNDEFLTDGNRIVDIEHIKDSSFNVWEKSLTKIGIGSLNNIIQDYSPDFSEVDHGVYSSFIFLKSLNTYKSFFNKEKGNIFYKLISLFHEGNSYTGAVYLEYENDFFKECIGQSILLHNLYPSKFNNKNLKKYRNKSSANPFNFLAIFADTFQRWDRDKLINPSKSNNIQITPGSKYNIEIKDDILYVSLKTAQGSLKDIENSLKNILGEFLFNGDKMIKFKIEQE